MWGTLMRGIANCSVWGALIIGTVGSARYCTGALVVGTGGYCGAIHGGVGSVGLYVVDSVGRHTNHTSPLLALPRPMCSD